MRKIQGSIKYKDLSAKEIEQVSMILRSDKLFSMSIDKEMDGNLIISMQDLIDTNIELKGKIELKELQVLIKQLTTMYKQLKFSQEIK